jgi:hypothetical protein
MLPEPILYSLARGSHVLVDKGQIYQHVSKKDSPARLRVDNEWLPLESSGTLKNLAELYPKKYSTRLQEFKQEYIEKVEGVESASIRELEKVLEKDIIKLFYITDVQNPYMASLGEESELDQIAQKTRGERKAFSDVLKWAGGKNRSLPKIYLPRRFAISKNKVYTLRRRFIGKKPVGAQVGNRSFFMIEFADLENLSQNAVSSIESILVKECEKEKKSIVSTLKKVAELRSAVASGVLGKGGFEYQNLGLGYCDGPIAYLRRTTNSREGVAVYLKKRFGNVDFSREAFNVSLNHNSINRLGHICLAHTDFYCLRLKLRKYPTGIALIKFLHNVRDRCWR